MRVNGAWSLTNPTMFVKTSLLRRMGSPFSEAATVVFVSPKWRPTFRTFRWSCRTDRPRPCRVRPDRGAATADFLDGVFGAAFLLELMLCLLRTLSLGLHLYVDGKKEVLQARALISGRRRSGPFRAIPRERQFRKRGFGPAILGGFGGPTPPLETVSLWTSRPM